MKSSKGGMSADFIMEMDADDFLEACEGAAALERRIDDAMKGR